MSTERLSVGNCDENERLDILVECCSAYMDGILNSLVSPCVVVVLLNSKEEVHRTKHVSRTLNPIWTVKHNSMFLLSMSKSTFIGENGLKFTIRDVTKPSRPKLGEVIVNVDDILRIIHETPSERKEFIVSPMSKRRSSILAKGLRMSKAPKAADIAKEIDPILALRFRNATPEDKQFFSDFKSYSGDVKFSKASSVPGMSNINLSFDSMMKSSAEQLQWSFRQGKYENETRKKLHRVRPYPDPFHKKETEWMTTEQLNETARQPSREWIDSGSGSFGFVYLEVLGCDDLPNMDLNLIAKNDKTDAFVSIVYEDAAVATDVIYDSLKPRWMPWTRRAFVFRMMHPSSVLFIGVFDYDKISENDFVGNVRIKPSRFTPGMEYLLRYKLHRSERTESWGVVDKREEYGTINVRLRIELSSNVSLLSMLKMGLRQPSDCYVNSSKAKHLVTLRQTCYGNDYPSPSFNFEEFMGYIDELFSSFDHLKFVFYHGFFNLIFWRGDLELPNIVHKSLTSKKNVSSQQHQARIIWAPINSILAFTWGLMLLDQPVRVFAFIIFCIPWILLNSKLHFQRMSSLGLGTPLYWDKTDFSRSMTEMNHRLVQEWKAHSDATTLQSKEVGNVIQEAEVDFETRKSNIFQKINVLNPYLSPYQKMLYGYCRNIRYFRNLSSWDLPWRAFAVILVCMLLSITLLVFEPVVIFIVNYSCRVIVWVFLGPWMALVDRFYVQPRESQSWDDFIESLSKTRAALLHETVGIKRIEKENKLKWRDMMTLKYGEYMIQTPTSDINKCLDTPLPDSSANTFVPQFTEYQSISRQKGTHLTGSMIFSEVSDDGLVQIYDSELAVLDDDSNTSDDDDPFVGHSARELLSQDSCNRVNKVLLSRQTGNVEEQNKNVGDIVKSNGAGQTHSAGMLKLKLSAVQLKRKLLKSKCNPFFVVATSTKCDQKGQLTEYIYRSDTITKSSNPSWECAILSLGSLCDNDLTKQFRVTVYENNNSSEPKLIGEVALCVNNILESLSIEDDVSIESRPRSGSFRLTKRGKTKGFLLVDVAEILQITDRHVAFGAMHKSKSKIGRSHKLIFEK